MGIINSDDYPLKKNAPSAFCRIMHQILGNLPFVEIYLDDITIYSKTLEEHFKHIETVIRKLKEAGLIIKPSKCTWLRTIPGR